MSEFPDAPELPDLDAYESAVATATRTMPVLRVCDEDGTVHFSHLKKLALSGVQYLHSVNNPTTPNRAMLVGTSLHFIILGARPDAKKLVRYDGERRSGKTWDAFLAAHPLDDHEIVTIPEWAEAEAMAASIRRSPIAQRRLEGATFEVPLKWEENGILCSTSGVDIIPVSGGIGDLKGTATTHPDTFMRHAFKMLYPMQLAFYARGMRANGLKVPEQFVLGVESKAPHEVVELTMTTQLADMADRTVTLWLEQLRQNMLAIPEPRDVFDWPGYVEAPVQWDVPEWMKEDGPEIDEEGEEAA